LPPIWWSDFCTIGRIACNDCKPLLSSSFFHFSLIQTFHFSWGEFLTSAARTALRREEGFFNGADPLGLPKSFDSSAWLS
jgi:hypothetical protein